MSVGAGKVAWVFPGQGSQKVGMAQALAAADPATAQFLRQVDDALGYDLSEIIARGPDDALQQTPNQQPAVVAVSVAYLWALDEQRRLPQPDFVAGHSLGEYSALVAAGALGALDAVRLVRRRGELMQAHGAGAMAAVLGMPPAAVAEVAAEAGAEVANFNAPDQTTVSGTEAAVERAMALAKERGAKRAVRLPVSGAFHSSLMAPVVEGMRGPLAATTIRPAAVPLVTDVGAKPVTEPGEIRQELLDQICGSVQWVDVVAFLTGQGVTTFYEIGPGKVLAGLIGRCAPGATVVTAESLLPA